MPAGHEEETPQAYTAQTYKATTWLNVYTNDTIDEYAPTDLSGNKKKHHLLPLMTILPLEALREQIFYLRGQSQVPFPADSKEPTIVHRQKLSET